MGDEGWSVDRLDFQIMARGNENQKATGALYGEWPKGHHSGVRVKVLFRKIVKQLGYRLSFYKKIPYSEVRHSDRPRCLFTIVASARIVRNSNKFTSRAFIVYKHAIKDTQPSCCLSESGIELSYIPLYLLIEFD